MKFLITGAFNCTEKELKTICDLGHRVVFMQNEVDEVPCPCEEIEGVICNGLFLHHKIEKFKNLKYIQLTSAGYDRVPMDYIEKQGIKINNARGVYSVPMAEFALAGVLSIYKNMKFFAENQKCHNWQKQRNIIELFGKKVCIVGCGSVGLECAIRFKAFGTKILGVDLEEKNCGVFDEVYSFERIKEAIKQSDIVLLTAPLTEQTKGLFNDELFLSFKDNAVLVNIARGKIVEETVLINALKGKLLGAVLDVFENEPLDKNSPLWDMKNVIITPHNSFVGDGNHRRLCKLIFENLKNI